MKITILSLFLVLFASACSHKEESGRTESTVGTNFTFSADDIASPAEVMTNRFGTVTVDITLSGAKAEDLRQFTQAHLNQQVEISFGSKVLMRPMIRDVISNGEVEVSFAPSDTNAQAVADLLKKR
jgi:preprotein translocase subunit SecD